MDYFASNQHFTTKFVYRDLTNSSGDFPA